MGDRTWPPYLTLAPQNTPFASLVLSRQTLYATTPRVVPRPLGASLLVPRFAVGQKGGILAVFSNLVRA